MQLQIWHIPQVPMKAFRVDVPDVETAKIVLQALADYDRFQFENSIKPDYANASGLEVLVDGEWEEWHSEDEDLNIWEVLRAEAA